MRKSTSSRRVAAQKLTLGRVTGCFVSGGCQQQQQHQRRRKTAVTNDADKSCRLRSLSAEERRIVARIMAENSDAYQELNRSVRLTFTGNTAISCDKLAANQARAKRAFEQARRPPGGLAAVAGSSVGGRPSALRRRSSRPRRQSRDCRPAAAAAVGNLRICTIRCTVESTFIMYNCTYFTFSIYNQTTKEGQPRQQQEEEEPSSSVDANCQYGIVRETTSSAETIDNHHCERCGTASSGSATPANLASQSSPICTASAATTTEVAKQLTALSLKGANSHTVDTVASLSCWVTAGSALLKHISAARDGGSGGIPQGVFLSTAAHADRQETPQSQQQQQQQPLELQQQQLSAEDWDPAEVNINRLIRRRHLDALLSNNNNNNISGGWP